MKRPLSILTVRLAGFSAAAFLSVVVTIPAARATSAAALSTPASVAKSVIQSRQPLPFSENQIVDLEKDWGANTRNAELAVEGRGWRVIRVEDDSPLARAGFHGGDLIPNERIDASLAAFNSESHRLAQRIVRVLNHLSQ